MSIINPNNVNPLVSCGGGGSGIISNPTSVGISNPQPSNWVISGSSGSSGGSAQIENKYYKSFESDIFRIEVLYPAIILIDKQQQRKVVCSSVEEFDATFCLLIETYKLHKWSCCEWAQDCGLYSLATELMK